MYKITDLYLAAYLRAVGFTCEIETKNKRCFFIFPTEAKETISEMMRQSSTDSHNVNALCIVNEIKQLKAYVNNQ